MPVNNADPADKAVSIGELRNSLRSNVSSTDAAKTVVGLQLQFLKKTRQHTVKSVTENAPASRSELRHGDVIVAINGQSLDGMTPIQVKALFKTEGSKPIEIEYFRDAGDETSLTQIWPHRASAARALVLPERELQHGGAAAVQPVEKDIGERSVEKAEERGERREEPSASVSQFQHHTLRIDAQASAEESEEDFQQQDPGGTSASQGPQEESGDGEVDPIRQDLKAELVALFRLRRAEQDRLIAELQEQAELEAALEQVRIERHQLARQHHELKTQEENVRREAQRYRESVRR